MTVEIQKSQILEEALKHIPFDGWNLNVFKQSANNLGLDPLIIDALFPRGVPDTLDYFGQWADEKMLSALSDTNIDDLKVRARIRKAVEKRIEILTPYKEAVSIAFKKLLHPQNARTGASITWRTSDVIWNWAGDQSDDYNRYTKRGLLSGVIASTMAYWLQDQSESHEKTLKFLNDRIENVLFVGKNIGKVVKPLESLVKNFIVPNIKSKI